MPDDRQVVGDEEARSNSLCRFSSKLMICAWIETSRAETGSSATTKSGFSASERAEADPLALAARELMRVAGGRIGRQADDLQQLRTRPAAWRRPRGRAYGRLADDPAHAVPRIQGEERVLEDHLHAPPQRTKLSSSMCVMSWPSKKTLPVGS